MAARDENTGARISPLGVKAVVAGAGALLVLMVVLLTLQLGELQESREHIEALDAKISVLREDSQPVLEDAAPLAERARPLVASAIPVVRELGQGLPALGAVFERLEPTLDRLPALTISGQRLISEAVPVLGTLLEADLGAALTELRSVAAILLRDGRLEATLDSSLSLLQQVEALGLPRRAVRSADRLQRVLMVQRRTLDVQKRALAVQKRLLDIQVQSFEHIRSIDLKTGGEVSPNGFDPSP